jgi:hypothetical protein
MLYPPWLTVLEFVAEEHLAGPMSWQQEIAASFGWILRAADVFLAVILRWTNWQVADGC